MRRILIAGLDGIGFLWLQLRVAGAQIERILEQRIGVQLLGLGANDAVAVAEP